jgi:hypothetical protein
MNGSSNRSRSIIGTTRRSNRCQYVGQLSSDYLSECNRYSISQLAHTLSPRTFEYPLIRERLQPSAFPNREISQVPVIETQRILATGNTVVPRL